MRVEIDGIENRGEPGEERLVLRVLEDTDLSYFVVLASRSTPGDRGVYAGAVGAYWFPSTEVSSGDRVFLYTGPGAAQNEPNDYGGTDWFFYWGLDETIWAYGKDTAVVVEAASWNTAAPEPDASA